MFSQIDDPNRQLKPSESGWSIEYHLAHILKVRHSFLTGVSPERATGSGAAVSAWLAHPVDDLNLMKSLLLIGGNAIHESVKHELSTGLAPVGSYDNPVLFLQHMLWHEAWHVGLIHLALQRGGQESPKEWEGIWSCLDVKHQ